MRHSIFHRHFVVPFFFLCMMLFFLFHQPFSKFTMELFRHEISQNTLNLHYTLADPSAYSINCDMEPTFGELTLETRKKEMDYLKACQKKLHRYSFSQLSDSEQLTCQILDWWMEGQIASEPYYYYQEPLAPTLGIHSQLPILLSEYAFRTREDIDVYLSLLSKLPDYFRQIAEFEKEKSRQGLFMSDETLDNVLAQCEPLMDLSDSHLLITSFHERLKNFDPLSQEEFLRYEVKNRSLLKESFLLSYQQLCQTLELLRGTGTNPYGLYYTPDGIAYYETLLKYTVGTSMTTANIQQILDETIETAYEDILYALNENIPLPTSDKKISSTNSPAQILRTLQIKIAEDFPQVEDISWEIKEVPEALAENLSPAFYMTPAIDQPEQNIIYINPSIDMDRTSLITTLAHEGYPGHLYQNSFENQDTYLPIRSLIYIGGYTEGWGLYSELYAYDFLGLPASQADLLRSFASLNYAICASLDLAIHTEGWTEEDCTQYLSSYGITDPVQIHDLYQNILEEPANYVKYYLGYLEICRLKEKALALSSHITLSDFHNWILSTGPAPFFLLEERLYLLVALQTRSLCA